MIEHGLLRQTKDVDLVINLQPENIVRGLHALATLGYQTRIPVTPDQFADEALRNSWIEDKHMLVLNLFSDNHIETPVGVFVKHPFDFEDEYAR